MERRNLYVGTCAYCRTTVAEQAGFLFKNEYGANKVRHENCGPETAAAKRDDAMNAALGTPDNRTEVNTTAPTQADLDSAAAAVVGQVSSTFLKLVPGMVADEVRRLSPLTIEVKLPGKGGTTKIDRAHKAFADILLAVTCGTNPFIVGPAGSGKTTLAEQICKALKRKFYMSSQVTSEYKLFGFVDAKGQVVRTAFREAFEHGGGFLLDEVDASGPSILTALNAALANGYCDFPDGIVKMHPDFFAVAAGNTFGRGADRQYVGRNQLDAATLDRFTVFEVDYDEELEVQIAGDADWVRYVQRVRKAAEAEKVRHIVSPRASIYGARLLAGGMDRAKVEEACIWKGLDGTNRGRIVAKMGSMGA